jgi:hypothetical protein
VQQRTELVKYEDLKFIQQIGSGGFGNVSGTLWQGVLSSAPPRVLPAHFNGILKDFSQMAPAHFHSIRFPHACVLPFTIHCFVALTPAASSPLVQVYYGHWRGSPVAIKVAVLRGGGGEHDAAGGGREGNATVAEFTREVTTMSAIPPHQVRGAQGSEPQV